MIRLTRVVFWIGTLSLLSFFSIGSATAIPATDFGRILFSGLAGSYFVCEAILWLTAWRLISGKQVQPKVLYIYLQVFAFVMSGWIIHGIVEYRHWKRKADRSRA